MRITSLTITDMWSYQKENNKLDDFGPTTIIIGANDSGKSNILRAINWFHNNFNWHNRTDFPLSPFDEHMYPEESENAQPALAMTVTFSDKEIDEVISLETFKRISVDLKNIRDELSLYGLSFAADKTWTGDAVKQKSFRFCRATRTDQKPSPGLVTNTDTAAWNTAIGDLKKWVEGKLQNGVEYIKANRQIGDQRYGPNLDLFHFLSRSRSPVASERHQKNRYQQFERLVKKFARDEDFNIDPQHDASQLNIDWRGRYLPLDRFGDGMSQFLIMAGVFSGLRDHIFLIEEPERGLHPDAQRTLLDIMTRDARNQYIITTHSSLFLDSGDADSVFRIQHDGDRSQVHRCTTRREMCDVLRLLGNRPSDILQANTVIWVEGPTDQYFIERCFELKKVSIRKGIDYGFAYLLPLKHATLNPENPDGRMLNLHDYSSKIVVMRDSDKKSEHDREPEHIPRIRKECKEAGGMLWLTDGREMENYIPDDVLTRAFRDFWGQESAPPIRLAQFKKLEDAIAEARPDFEHGDQRNVLYKRSGKMILLPKILDKMTVEHLKQFDLNGRLDELIDYISG